MLRFRVRFLLLICASVVTGLVAGFQASQPGLFHGKSIRKDGLRSTHTQARKIRTNTCSFEEIVDGGEIIYSARGEDWQIEFHSRKIVIYGVRACGIGEEISAFAERGVIRHQKREHRCADESELAKIQIRYAGSNPHARPAGVGRIARKTSYFMGARKEGWRRNVPSYDTLLYENLYDGIDLVFYYSDDKLKSEYRVHPGADYRTIRILYSGQESLHIRENGDLVITTGVQEFVEESPIAWQVIGSRRVERKVDYALATQSECRFKVHDYSSGYSLTIDPVYSSLFGGNGIDGVADILDAGSQLLIASVTTSTNLPRLSGSYNQSASGERDIHLLTIANDGSNTALFTTYYGGGKEEHLSAIEKYGDRYVIIGSTNSNDLPVTSDAYQKQSRGGYDLFIAIFNLDCTELLYGTYLGGAGDDFCEDAVLDNNGNIYITGWTDSFGFPRSSNAAQRQYGGGLDDAFLTVMSQDGRRLIYSTFLGASDADEARSVAVDERGRIAVCGVTLSADFLTTGNAIQQVMQGVECGFMTVYDTSDYQPVYSSFFGGWPNGIIKEVASTHDGGFVFVGETTSTELTVTPGVFQPVKAGTSMTDPWDMFLLRVDSNYQTVWCSYLGGSSLERVSSILYSAGKIVLTAYTYSDDYPLVRPYRTQVSDVDAILSIIDGYGKNIMFSTLWGGDGYDMPNKCRVIGKSLIICGFTKSYDFPVIGKPLEIIRDGETDGWLTIFDLDELLVGVQPITAQAPSDIQILDNYPNPFDGGGTLISYFLNTPSAVHIDIFDTQGRLVFSRDVEKTRQGANAFHYIDHEAEGGVYYVRISDGTCTAVKRMLKI